MTVITKKDKENLQSLTWGVEWHINEIRQTLEICNIKDSNHFCYANIKSNLKLLEEKIDKVKAYF